uniref:ABC transporter domain-containing protein n=1 Tax=Oryza rufipogon TaxID=4529 RepID=A0A0E0QPX2_ORYRU
MDRMMFRLYRVGIKLPTIEVRYKNLNVEAESYVGSRGLPTILNTYANILKNDLAIRFSWLWKNITVVGLGWNTPINRKTYVSQHDLHMAELTVRETINFSAKCQGVGHHYDLFLELLRREEEENITPDPETDIYLKAATTGEEKAEIVTNHILKILRLDICADTIVGDNMLRGISGGQKRRLTTAPNVDSAAEMLVTLGRALFMDEISNGLDSSTTFQIVNTIQQTIHVLGGTAVIALLQPAPETYELFDDIILLSDGQVVYSGPRDHVLEFFKSLGFKCPERKGVADFLQEVTSRKDQKQYWIHGDDTYRYIPVTVIAEAFQCFHVGQAIRSELAIPFDNSKSHIAALKTSKHGVNLKKILKANIDGEILLLKRKSFLYIFNALQLTLVAIIAMSVFIHTNMHHDSIENGRMYMGVQFFGTLAIMFKGLAEMGAALANLPVFFKQRDLLFYPAWTYSLPSWIIKTPISFLNTIIWVSITYYVIGFDPNIERQFLVLFVMSEAICGLFRFIAALTRHPVVASTVSEFCILIVMVSSGFILSRDEVKKWLIWEYWTSPLMYALNALAVNEFLSPSWNEALPGFREPLGRLVLESRGVFLEAKWYWIGLGALLGYVLLFNILYTICLSILTYTEGGNNDEATSSNANHNSSPARKGSILPFVPVYMTFEDIRYSIDMPKALKVQGMAGSRLELLKDLSGSFRPGVLTALMGISGAGKTTLLDVLAGRKTSGHIHGNITVSGYPKKQETFSRVSGYCEQNDIHSPNLTVYESLMFSAWLRLPAEIDSMARKRFIDEFMELVELFPLKDALVGLPGLSGLSTEQRKRLTIAVELVANPSIIFMDEPTSGLDARAAAIVMRTVRNIVDMGRTVVCTIHQPSIDIFESFDELFLMKRGGEAIYVGPLGQHSCELIKYFEEDKTWLQSFNMDAGSDLRNKNLIKELSTPHDGSSDLLFPTKYSQTFVIQCLACLWKQRLSYWRNPPYIAVNFFFTVVIALLFGTMFWGVGRKRQSQQALLSAMGSMYSTCFTLGVQNSSSVQPVVNIERTVFYRERASHMYSPLPYALGQVVVELPYIFLQTLIYGVIVYSMMGYEWTCTKFFWYMFFMYFTLSYFTFYGMMAAGLTPNYTMSSIRIPIWWRWYYWICPVAWTINGLVTSQFGDVDDKFDNGVRVSDFVESYFGYNLDLLWVAAMAVVSFAILFAILFGFSLKLFNFQKR